MIEDHEDNPELYYETYGSPIDNIEAIKTHAENNTLDNVIKNLSGTPSLSSILYDQYNDEYSRY